MVGYIYLSGALWVAVFLLAYRYLFAINDAMWLFVLCLMAVLFAFFYVACLPFKRVQVVDFYSDVIELRPWNFWTGRGRTVLQRITYADVLAVESVAGHRNTLGLRLSQDTCLLLRDKPKLREFIRQKLPH